MTPLPLGISVKTKIPQNAFKRFFKGAKFEDVMEVMIKQNVNIPISAEKRFHTTEKNQTEFTVTVLEGEKRLAQENCLISQFTIRNLRPAKAGEVSVNVTYFVD